VVLVLIVHSDISSQPMSLFKNPIVEKFHLGCSHWLHHTTSRWSSGIDQHMTN